MISEKSTLWETNFAKRHRIFLKDNSLELLSSGTKDIELISISEGFEEFLKAYFKVSVASPE